MTSTVTAQGRFGARLGSAVLQSAIVALGAFAASLALVRHGGVGPALPTSAEIDPLGIALVAASTLPLVAWRRAPLAVFVVTAAASVTLVGLDYRLDLPIGPTVALFLLALSREPAGRWGWRPTTAAAVAFLVVYLGAAAAAQGTVPGSELLHAGLAMAVAWFAGERMRLRHEQLAGLAERMRHAERDLERERLLAAAEERARIARDLHDSAGHAINVIAVRAGAARLRHHENPDRSLRALEAIEEVARQTADEIDRIVGTLRGGGAPAELVEAPVGLASLDTLVARHREAGLDVSVEVSGRPRGLGAAADQAAYRIVQEALTNAARHGGGRVRAVVAFGDDGVEVSVSNALSTRQPPPTSGGHGLVGMRERATLVGGSFDVERRNGTYGIRARIPYGGTTF